nr:hypothetical protein Itr_chr09CG20350 [Ipomoea trifida]
MIILDNRIFSHHFHGENPIALCCTPPLHSHLKHLPKSPFPDHPQDLKVIGSNLSDPQIIIFNNIVIIVNSSYIFFSLVFPFGVDFLVEREREGFREGEARGRAEKGVRAAVDNLWVSWKVRGRCGEWAEEFGEFEVGVGSGFGDFERERESQLRLNPGRVEEKTTTSGVVDAGGRRRKTAEKWWPGIDGIEM